MHYRKTSTVLKVAFPFVILLCMLFNLCSCQDLASVSQHWQGKKGRFLMISPHDDDAALGAGLLIQLAKRENVPVYILIVTDGSMGYCSVDEKDSIDEIRRNESFECYQALGVPKKNIVWLDFPDCRLSNCRGRKPVEPNFPLALKGFTGLQNAFTYWLRKIKPTQCFLPTHNDLHPLDRIRPDSLFHRK